MIIDYFVNDIIKAQQFDEIWNIINNQPFKFVTAQILAQQFKENKKLKVTNSIINSYRDYVRPDIVEGLQDNLYATINNR